MLATGGGNDPNVARSNLLQSETPRQGQNKRRYNLHQMYVRANRGFGSLTQPIAGTPLISSLFGPRAQPTAGASIDHQGIDYAVPVGTPVLADGPGTVVFAGVQSGFGNTVVIDNGGGVTTLYGHLSSIGVSQGQSVGGGSQIALSGATGTVSGPNLHFQVMVNGVPVDPTTQLAPDVNDSDFSDLDSLLPDFSDDLTTAGIDLGNADPVTVGVGLLVAGLLVYAVAS